MKPLSLNIKKSHYYMIIGVILYFVLSTVLYANYVMEDVVSRDQWRFLDTIKQFNIGGNWLVTLWETHSQQRTPLYKFWFLINAIYFNLNSFVDIYIGIVALFFTSIIVVRNIAESSGGYLGWWGVLVLVAVVTSIFSFNQWSQITYGLNAFQDFFGSLCMLLLFMYFAKVSNGQIRIMQLASTLVIIVSYIILIGEVRTPAVIGAAIISLSYSAVCKESNSRQLIMYVAFIAIVSIFAFIVYFFSSPPLMRSTGARISLGLVQTLHEGALYIFYYFANGIIPVSMIQAKVSPGLIALTGCISIVISVFTVYLGHAGGIYKKNIIPLMLILFSVFYCVELLLGRFSTGSGLMNAAAPRYANEVMVGSIGVIWTLGIFLVKKQCYQSKYPMTVVKAVILFCLSLNVTSYVLVVAHAKYQRKAHEKYVSALISIKEDGTSKIELPRWACNSKELCTNGLEILKEYRLSLYRYKR